MKPLLRSALVSLLLATVGTGVAQAASTVLYFSMVNSGSGQHNTPGSVPVSGVMTALVPRFNGGLGTLIQADFEFAGSANGSWTADPGFTGTMDFGLSGPVDVGGQPMGPLVVGFPPTAINDQGPTTIGGVNFVNATFTTGAFFNSLTGVGNETLTWVFSGTSNVIPQAIGEFDWGGTAHILYTYEPVPEPSTLVLCGLGAACWLVALRRRG
jgi:hypothetical protein